MPESGHRLRPGIAFRQAHKHVTLVPAPAIQQERGEQRAHHIRIIVPGSKARHHESLYGRARAGQQSEPEYPTDGVRDRTREAEGWRIAGDNVLAEWHLIPQGRYPTGLTPVDNDEEVVRRETPQDTRRRLNVLLREWGHARDFC